MRNMRTRAWFEDETLWESLEGFSAEYVYGSLDGSLYDQTAQRRVAVATK